MKAIVLTENGVELREVKLGVIPQGWARIKVAETGLCGSDVAKISAPSLPAWHTRILGHEFYGKIAELSGPTEGISIGDRIVAMPLLACDTCNACRRGQENLCVQGQAIGRTIQGAFAEYVDVPLKNIVRIPSDHQIDPYILTDPLSVCIHASNLAQMTNVQRRCLIVGDGTIGCLLAWFLRIRGHEVWISGKHNEALEFTESFGVKIADTIQTRHFDVVFEAVGRSQRHSLDNCLRAVRWGGIIVVLGVFSHGYEYPLIARDMFIGEVKMVGANAYLSSDFKEAVLMIEAHNLALRTFISHRFPLDRFEDALVMAKTKRGFTMKIVLETEGLS